MSQTIIINSVNYDGEEANILFTPDNDPTAINLGTVILPYTFNPGLLTPPRQVYGTYSILTLENQCFNLLNVPRPTPSPTPTKTPTRTPTPTPSITPTITPTSFPCITRTPTPTPGLSPTPTPTINNTPTPTPTLTSTITPTPTMTPTPTPSQFIYNAYLFIEPESGSTSIGLFMYGSGSNFLGFTNGSQPSANPATFDTDMNTYLSYPGWNNGSFPSIVTQNIPANSGGVDAFGNAVIAYNFFTTRVPSNTVGSTSWYTWIIPIQGTNFGKQVEIGLNAVGVPNSLTPINTESTIYANTFTYAGGVIPAGTYRVYTTFPNQIFRLSNTYDIYFKGNDVQP